MRLKGNYRLFRLKDVDIKFNLSIIALPLIAYINTDSVLAVLLSLAFTLFIILAHELGHYYVAKKLKYNATEIVLHCFGGYCEIDMPGNERDEVFISWGGILFQMMILAITIPVLIILKAVGLSDNIWYKTLYERFVGINVIIMIINMVPLPFFDGEKIWKIFKYLKRKPKLKLVPKEKPKTEMDLLIEDVVKKAKKRK